MGSISKGLMQLGGVGWGGVRDNKRFEGRGLGNRRSKRIEEEEEEDEDEEEEGMFLMVVMVVCTCGGGGDAAASARVHTFDRGFHREVGYNL
ncbi:hypothetical protein M0804_007194 [Polistes exclamans]|nr:hypothetical protein M0804_007194 [Polistes exclamans]